MIDVEFHGEQKILDAWADLYAHYNTNYEALGIGDPEVGRLHSEKYSTLLYEIGQLLGYKFGKTHIRDNVYRPGIHNEIDVMELETRRLTRNLLNHLMQLEALPVQFIPNSKTATADQTTTTEPDKK
jgi:hypothetical protein